MAQHKSAEKRARISKRRAARNTVLKSKMRTAIKRVRSTSEKEKAVVELRKTSKLLDQLAAKGIIHKNRAANNKSSLTKFVNKLKYCAEPAPAPEK
jgi:small subunit ribosomal protein S20